MKKRKVFLGALLLSSVMTFAQVGVGTVRPHNSTLLHLENQGKDYKGMLIPNVPLINTVDGSLINNGDILESLLVFNTATVSDVTPGYYYWKNHKWVRVLDTNYIAENLNQFPTNKIMEVRLNNNIDSLVVEDTFGNIVSVPIEDVNVLTSLVLDDTDGLIFTDEHKVAHKIDIADYVITNIRNNTDVQNEIYNTIAANGKELKADDASIVVKDGEKAVLNQAGIMVAPAGITTDKIKGGKPRNLLITNANGEVTWVDASDSTIKDLVKQNETITRLEVGEDGTFVYVNELIGKNGAVESAAKTKFDANTLTIVEKEDEKGVYIFSDKKGVLKVVDTRASNIYFDDSTIESGNSNVQEVIETIFEKFGIIEGQQATLAGTGILINDKAQEDNAVLVPISLSIAPKAITESKLNENAVTRAKVAWHAITEDKLYAGNGNGNKVPVSNDDGSVQFKSITAALVGEKLSTDNSLVADDTSNKSLIAPLTLKVNDEGIKNKHIASNAVTEDKISSAKGEKEYYDRRSVLAADGAGNSEFIGIDNLLIPDFTGDLQTDSSLVITNGNDVLFSKGDEKTNIQINQRGVNSGHIAIGTIIEENIANRAITASKLSGGDKAVGSVATVTDSNGTVEYQPITASSLKDTATLSTDGSIALVDTAGGENTQQDNTLFAAAKLAIATSGVQTSHVAAGAITADKLSSKNVTDKHTLVSDGKGNVFWGELGDIADLTSGDLRSDGIIEINSFEDNMDIAGEGALLKNVILSISDNSITKKKLSSKSDDVLGSNIDKDMVLLTDGNGGFDYVTIEATQVDGDDLKLGNSLEFTNGSGVKSVLNPTTIAVKDAGITTAKLADAAVTTAKISSVVGTSNATNNAVLTADGTGKVAYVELAETAFNGKGANLTSDASLTVTGDKGALLKNTTLAIAKNGVQTQHIATKSVTTDKIGSGEAANNLFMVSKDGGAVFSPLGNALEGSAFDMHAGTAISITNGAKSTLKDVTIDVKDLGITNGKIAENTILARKLHTGNATEGSVLTAIGNNLADYRPISTLGKPLSSDNSIKVSTRNNVVLDDVSVSVNEGGILTNHLGAKQVTTAKISSKIDTGNAARKLAMVADGDGGVYFEDTNRILPKGNITNSKTITASKGALNSVLQDVTLEVLDLSIGTEHIIDNSVSSAKLANDAVTTIKINRGAVTSDKINEGAVTTDKISSTVVNGNAAANTVLTADGMGKVAYKKLATSAFEGNEANLLSDGSIAIPDNNKALLNSTSIKIADRGVQTNHLANKAVTTDKISSQNGEANVASGTLLVADGQGATKYQTLNEVLPMAKFFYMPAMYVEIVSGKLNMNKDVYADYQTQFSKPRASSKGSTATLPYYKVDQLYYHVTYYDDTVFYNVSISNKGILTYSVKDGATPTGKTFFNIILEIK